MHMIHMAYETTKELNILLLLFIIGYIKWRRLKCLIFFFFLLLFGFLFSSFWSWTISHRHYIYGKSSFLRERVLQRPLLPSEIAQNARYQFQRSARRIRMQPWVGRVKAANIRWHFECLDIEAHLRVWRTR